MDAGYMNMPYQWRRYYEKQDIRRAGNYVGAGFLLSNVLASVLTSILMIIISILYPQMYNDLSNMIWVLQFYLSIFMFTVPFLIVPSGVHSSVSEVVTLKKVRFGMCTLLVLMTLGVSSLANFVSIGVDYVWTGIFGRELVTPSFDMPDNIIIKWIYIISVTAVPALVEEFALRGIVLGSLRRFGNMFAVVISAILFGLMHGNLVQGIFAFILGIALGICVIMTDSLWPAIIAHFLNNLMATILNEVVTLQVTEEMAGLISLAYMMGIMVIGIIALIIVLVKYGGRLKLRPDTVISAGGRTGIFFTSVGMIFALLMFAATMFINEFGSDITNFLQDFINQYAY